MAPFDWKGFGSRASKRASFRRKLKCSHTLLRNRHMQGVCGVAVCINLISEGRQIHPRKKAFARAKKYGRIGQVHFIDESGAKVFSEYGDPSPSRMSFPSAASRARASALSIPSVTKWNVVPPLIAKELRAWLASTKTGVRNGGSSLHHPFQESSGQALAPAQTYFAR
jgi:hypothetical protein